MNDRKIAFILCVNNELYYEECLWYINHLHVPEGYETDLIRITEAEGIAQAYNAAMVSSDARYKVYLHQDVFIYHREFIEDILKVFQSDERLGMLGVFGGVDLPDNAMVYSAWNRGCTFFCVNAKNASTLHLLPQDMEGGRNYTEVEAIDGMLMATQYDIRWREDLDLGWDFYDLSQSLEFRRQGYRVGIPFQRKPWCMHDCGYTLLKDDKGLQKILKEYRDFFPERYAVLQGWESANFQRGELYTIWKKSFEIIKSCFENGNFEQVLQIKNAYGYGGTTSNDLQCAMNLAEIYELEKTDVTCRGSFFFGLGKFEDMREKYNMVKFIIYHMENETDPERVGQLLELIEEGIISQEAVWSIAERSAVDKDKVYKRLSAAVSENRIGLEL
jgi:hypothetical protein